MNKEKDSVQQYLKPQIFSGPYTMIDSGIATRINGEPLTILWRNIEIRFEVTKDREKVGSHIMFSFRPGERADGLIIVQLINPFGHVGFCTQEPEQIAKLLTPNGEMVVCLHFVLLNIVSNIDSSFSLAYSFFVNQKT